MRYVKAMMMVALAGTALWAVGCSKKESEKTPPPPDLQPTMSKKGDLATAPPPAPPAEPVKDFMPMIPQAETPEQLAAQVKKLESDYEATLDFQKRVVIIYNMSSVESPEAIDAVTRLFFKEKDKELKVELIDSLLDIDGENDKKLALLSAATRADQPKEVRLEAIDGMEDTEDKRAIQLLQSLLTDPDEEVRDAAKDSIEQLQVSTNPPPPAK